jgi:hypothetical protein
MSCDWYAEWLASREQGGAMGWAVISLIGNQDGPEDPERPQMVVPLHLRGFFMHAASPEWPAFALVMEHHKVRSTLCHVHLALDTWEP